MAGVSPSTPCQRIPELRLVGVVGKKVHAANLFFTCGPFEPVVLVEIEVVALFREALRGLPVKIYSHVVVEFSKIENAAPRAGRNRRCSGGVLHEPVEHGELRRVSCIRRDGAEVLVRVLSGDPVEVDEKRVCCGVVRAVLGDDPPADHLPGRQSCRGDWRRVDFVAGENVRRDAVVEHVHDRLRAPHRAVGDLHGAYGVERRFYLRGYDERRAARAPGWRNWIFCRVCDVWSERRERRTVCRSGRLRVEVRRHSTD